jgi:predicted nuclease of restriction endonuclease-like (RecB) superfamily
MGAVGKRAGGSKGAAVGRSSSGQRVKAGGPRPAGGDRAGVGGAASTLATGAAQKGVAKASTRRASTSELAKAAQRPRQGKAEGLFERVVTILEASRERVVRAVNAQMVTAYWLIGREIVEAVQGGDARAKYGERVLEELSHRLTERYGKGFSVPNLRNFRQFYTTYAGRSSWVERPLGRSLPRAITGHAPADRSANPEKRYPPGSESMAPPEGFSVALGWSHYRALMRVENPKARAFYEREAASGGWSKAQLERQIESFYYERLLASRDKQGMLEAGRRGPGGLRPADLLKDPYVLEFLDLPDVPRLHESSLEEAILANLQSFLLELGKGFAFVARQKHLRLDDEDFYVDLVFYNYVLKCFVLIDLKVGKLTHQDIGQMDTYVRIFEAHTRGEGDNPTIGLILCSKKNEAVARYSVLHESRQLFAARYLTYLPSEDEMARELERERQLIEARGVSGGGRGALPRARGRQRRRGAPPAEAVCPGLSSCSNFRHVRTRLRGPKPRETRVQTSKALGWAGWRVGGACRHDLGR